MTRCPSWRLISEPSPIDEAVGRLTAYLDSQGLTEDTIIIFQSDHGHSNEERTFGAGGSAGPYRGSKFSLFACDGIVDCMDYMDYMDPGNFYS